MNDSTFSKLYEAVDFSLHKLKHILNATETVSDNMEPLNETLDTLLGIAIDQVAETRSHLQDLHKHYYVTKKARENAEA